MSEKTEERKPPREHGNAGIWYRKADHRDFLLLFDPKEPVPENCTRSKPLDGVEHQRFDEKSGEWVPDPDAERLKRIEAAKTELDVIDEETGSGRSVRALALAAAEKNGVKGRDYDLLMEYEAKAKKLRAEIASLTEGNK